MHRMSDGYLADELIDEYGEKQVLNSKEKRIKAMFFLDFFF